MDLISLAYIAGGLSLAMMIAWAVQRLTGNSGWVDVIWSSAVGLGGLAAALLPDPGADPHRRIVVGVLIALWSARLAWHIAGRAAKGEDDPRYAEMAQQAGKAWPLQLFIFLQIQAAAAFVLVVAVRLAAIHPGPFPAIGDMIGAVLLIVAVAGEGIADAQLARFGREHKGQKAVCDTGLWRYSRHPNYFFEWLGWCAWAVIAFDALPVSWLALGAPLLMYVLLAYVSGVPPLEKHMLKSRGARFRDYQARTNAFFPGPPHKPKLSKEPS